jgi:hypothetical protein
MRDIGVTRPIIIAETLPQHDKAPKIINGT